MIGFFVFEKIVNVSLDLVFMTMQWTVQVPVYKLKPSKLDTYEAKFHRLCSRLKKMTPICINGLPDTGWLNIWSASVQELVDDDWGLVLLEPPGRQEGVLLQVCLFLPQV